jgi:hypothetical protein
MLLFGNRTPADNNSQSRDHDSAYFPLAPRHGTALALALSDARLSPNAR